MGRLLRRRIVPASARAAAVAVVWTLCFCSQVVASPGSPVPTDGSDERGGGLAACEGDLPVVGAGGQRLSESRRSECLESRKRAHSPSWWTRETATLLYAPLLGRALLWATLEPPATPRFFSAAEGGASRRGDSVPSAWAAALAAGAALPIGLSDDPDRWIHLQGYLEAFAVSQLVTELAKLLVGRHRPDFDAAREASVADQRKSFFSGHASATFVATTYLSLYLADHGRRGGRGPSPWISAQIAGLTAVATGIAYSRVRDHRHHLSDVVVGSGVGALSAWLLYRRRAAEVTRDRRWRPTITTRGFALSRSF